MAVGQNPRGPAIKGHITEHEELLARLLRAKRQGRVEPDGSVILPIGGKNVRFESHPRGGGWFREDSPVPNSTFIAPDVVHVSGPVPSEIAAIYRSGFTYRVDAQE